MRGATFADAALARRLERAEARTNAAFVEARARLAPDGGAGWREVHGTYAMFDGAASPLTQTFGLALFAPASGDDLATLERFFDERGAPVFHEVSPLADAAVLPLLHARGYAPVELTTVLFRELPGDARDTRDARDATAAPSDVRVRRIAPGEEARWAETSARGWGATPELAAFMRDFGTVNAHAPGMRCFLAERGGEPIAAAALAVHDGVALLAGASTCPEFRGRGAQAALLQARLHAAAADGCELAMMGAAPGSASQRNAERQGFRVAYTRTKWQRMEAT